MGAWSGHGRHYWPAMHGAAGSSMLHLRAVDGGGHVSVVDDDCLGWIWRWRRQYMRSVVMVSIGWLITRRSVGGGYMFAGDVMRL